MKTYGATRGKKEQAEAKELETHIYQSGQIKKPNSSE